ncbi:MAG TPA: N-acetyltransferase [Candidatus Methylomirabilis sp.]|nr:N-acetyltransferase [Candidatus Methylomirabilis sp.]
MRLRRARLADLDALVRLEQSFSSDRLSRANFRHLLRRGHAEIWVCENRGEVAGNAVVLYRRGVHAARCYSLVVRPNQRRHGIARALLKHAEAAALSRGCREMRLEMRTDNAAARGFYRKHGYATTGKIPGFYEDGSEATKMCKRLGRAAGT